MHPNPPISGELTALLGNDELLSLRVPSDPGQAPKCKRLKIAEGRFQTRIVCKNRKYLLYRSSMHAGTNHAYKMEADPEEELTGSFKGF